MTVHQIFENLSCAHPSVHIFKAKQPEFSGNQLWPLNTANKLKLNQTRFYFEKICF